MANAHETLTGLFTDIAGAIRSKTGGTGAIVADQFPDAIAAIDTQENLDAELSTQDDLIAQITAAVGGKAVPGEQKKTVSVTISVSSDARNTAMYCEENRGVTIVSTGKTVTVDALYGIVTLTTSTTASVECTGDHTGLGNGTELFFSDGGTYSVSRFINSGGEN